MYHRSERPFRKGLNAALASTDRAAADIDDSREPAPNRTSVRVKRILRDIGALIPPAMFYGTAPPMECYDHAKALQLYNELGGWVREAFAWAPNLEPAQSFADTTSASQDPPLPEVPGTEAPGPQVLEKNVESLATTKDGEEEHSDTHPSFSRLGKTWQIRYQNELGSFADGVGFQRIYLLLLSQDKEVRIEELVGKAELSRGDRVHDPRSVENLESVELELLALVEQVGKDPLEIQAAREDLEKVQAELRSAHGPSKVRKRLGDQGKAAADTVAQSIRRTLRVIAEDMPQLADHLRTGIVRPNSMSPAYRPSTPLNWIL